MSVDLTRLIGLVKSSRLLSEAERKGWFQKMETMDGEQLKELEEILLKAEQINWEEELPKYEAALAKAEQVIQQF